MIHKVSVVKKIMFLVMTMALAVAMVACSGAAGTPGPAGPPGKDAPTPDPTTPTTPTTPTEPTGGAAPEVTMMFPDIYLTLAGPGDKDRSFTLREHFADIDSLLKYTVTSSDATIATAAVTDGVLKVTKIKDGNAIITVTAADDEGLSTAVDEFSVTVAKTNAIPTTHGLSITDTTALQKKLYYRDGPRTHNVTVVSNPGAATGAVAVTDSILTEDFNVVVGKEKSAGVDDPTDNKISVKVTKTGAHSYSIVITPNLAGFGGETSQLVKIYPKDMFRAQVKAPWEFMAMYNPPPKTLSKSFHLELKRGTGTPLAVTTVTAGASGAGATGENTGNVGRVVISDFFILDSLERTMGTPDDVGDAGDTDIDSDDVTALTDATATAAAAVARAKIDKVGDTVCTVSPKSSPLAVVMSLNEAGAFHVVQEGEETGDEVDHKDLIVAEGQALNAIRIDSRYSALGTDNIQTDPPSDVTTNPASYATYQSTKDPAAAGTGTFTVTISCTDKDETATVTGTVVVRS